MLESSELRHRVAALLAVLAAAREPLTAVQAAAALSGGGGGGPGGLQVRVPTPPHTHTMSLRNVFLVLFNTHTRVLASAALVVLKNCI